MKEVKLGVLVEQEVQIGGVSKNFIRYHELSLYFSDLSVLRDYNASAKSDFSSHCIAVVTGKLLILDWVEALCFEKEQL